MVQRGHAEDLMYITYGGDVVLERLLNPKCWISLNSMSNVLELKDTQK